MKTRRRFKMFIINKNIIKLVTFLLFTLGIAISAHAVTINPISYDMQNGQSGSYHYWDENYSGTGSTTTNLASLSGGLGDLTDGIIATTNWNVAEAPPGNGPYVGWYSINPIITFHFGAPVSIDSITFYVDDSNGVGGVYTPSGFIINGNPYTVSDPPGSAPTSFTFSNLGLNLSDLTVTVNRKDNRWWVFLSEVDFDGNSAVPEPSTLLLLGSGLICLGYFIRRRRG